MKWPRYPGRFNLVLLLLAALLLGEAGLWIHAHRLSRHALAACDQLTRELSALSRVSPAGADANAIILQQETEKAEQTLATWREAEPGWNDPGSTEPAPAQSLDVYFDLIAWTDRTRARAADARITIRPIERFGFASLTNEGPPAELAPIVWRQRLRLHALLELLFAAHPHAVLSVQRENPRLVISRESPARPAESSRAAADIPAGPETDYFIPEPRRLIRSTGQCSSEAFRLEFIGETPVLRTFLNSVAREDIPVLVRSVSVAPLDEAAPSPRHPEASAAPELGILVAPTPLRFVVVIEWIEALHLEGKPAP